MLPWQYRAIFVLYEYMMDDIPFPTFLSYDYDPSPANLSSPLHVLEYDSIPSSGIPSIRITTSLMIQHWTSH